MEPITIAELKQNHLEKNWAKQAGSYRQYIVLQL